MEGPTTTNELNDGPAGDKEDREFPTFRVPSSDEPRWVWHPLVHQAFGESCLFFLCRLVLPDRDSIYDKIEELLGDAGITSGTVYPLLGHYDGLIRLWATEEQRGQFLVNARKSPTVQSLYEFRVQSVNYTWWRNQDDLTELDLDAHLETCRVIARAQISQRLGSDAGLQEQLHRLRKLHIVHLLDPIPDLDSWVKFYVVVESQTFEHAERVAQGINDHLANNRPATLHHVSVYEGQGFGTLLLKAVADDFSSLVAETDEIARIAASLNSRQMTLPLLHPRGGESDAISTVEDHLGAAVLNLIKRMTDQLHLSDGQSENVRARFESMLPVDRESYAQLVADYPTVFPDTRDGHSFLQMLLALIFDDVDSFGDSLIFLQKLESLLRRYLRRIWVELYGNDWVSVLRGYCEGDKFFDANREPSSWTLSDLVRLSEKASEHDPKFRNLADQAEALGNTWRSTVGKVTTLRNDVAHGRVYEYKTLDKFYPAVRGLDQSQEIRGVLDAAVLFMTLTQLQG